MSLECSKYRKRVGPRELEDGLGYAGHDGGAQLLFWVQLGNLCGAFKRDHDMICSTYQKFYAA